MQEFKNTKILKCNAIKIIMTCKICKISQIKKKVCVCMYVCMYVCVCVYIYIYIYFIFSSEDGQYD